MKRNVYLVLTAMLLILGLVAYMSISYLHKNLTQDVFLKCQTCKSDIVILCDYEHVVVKNKNFTEELPSLLERCIALGEKIVNANLYSVQIVFEGFRKGKKNRLIEFINDKRLNWIYTQDIGNQFSTKSFCRKRYKEIDDYNICTDFEFLLPEF